MRAGLPWLVIVAEVNPLTEGWVIDSKEDINRARPRVTEALLLLFHEASGCCEV